MDQRAHFPHPFQLDLDSLTLLAILDDKAVIIHGHSVKGSNESFVVYENAKEKSKDLRVILLELGYPQDSPTPLYEDNMSAINMTNNRVPTEHSRHIDIQHVVIQDWAEAKDMVMRHISGILSIPDGLTKALGWVLDSGHARCMMGHFLNSLAVAPILLI